MQLKEMIRQASGPYLNPGMDVGVDEAYHGIAHGMGIANPSQIDHTLPPGDMGF